MLSVGGGLLVLAVAMTPVLAGCSESAAHGAPSVSPSAAVTQQATLTVPNIVGMKGDEAADALKNAGFTAEPAKDADGKKSVWKKSNWTVTAQDPQAGDHVPASQAITLTVHHDTGDASPSPAPTPAEQATEDSQPAPQPVQPQPEEPAQVQPEPEQPAEQVEPEAPWQEQAPQQQEAYYANCKEAKAAGAAPLYEGDPGYRPKLDRDHDGIACEQ